MKVSSNSTEGFSINFGNSVSGSAGTSTVNGSRKMKSSGKKRLNYNSSEIRSSLMRAVKSQSAGKVMSTAKVKLSTLLKCKGSGQYDEGELDAAIAHAKRMVRCAQMKVQNLKKEEQIQKRLETSQEGPERDKSADKLERAALKKRLKNELLRRRKMNRSEECSEMDKTDMEYRAKQSHNLQNGGIPDFQTMSVLNEIFNLEISQEGAKLSDAQLEQMAEQMIEGNSVTAATVPGGSVDPGMTVPAGGSGSAGAALTGAVGTSVE